MRTTLDHSRIDPSPVELLLAEPGWRPEGGPPLRISAGGQRYTLRPLARRDGRLALIHRSAAERQVPSYEQRRRVARGAERRMGPVVVVFTDACGVVEGWHWTEALPSGASLLRGALLLPGAPRSPLRERLRAADAVRSAPPTLPGTDAAALAAALLRRVPGAPPPSAADPLGDVLRRIEGAAAPGGVRGWWRALRRLRVLDARCGSGERLHAVAAALAPLLDAVLERMAGSLDELALCSTRHRPEKRGDFRAHLARADDRRRFRDRRAFAWWLLLRDTLHGAEVEPALLTACAERLRAAAVAAGSPAPHRLALFAGDPAAGFASEAEVRRAVGSGADGDATLRRLREEGEAIARARRILRGQEDRDAPAMDDGALEARLPALRRELDGWRAAEEGVERADGEAVARWAGWRRPVHLWAEAWEAMEGGGFDLRFGERGGQEPRAQVRERRPTFALPPGSLAPAGAEGVTVQTLHPGEPSYPERVRDRLHEDAPDPLFARGDLRLLDAPALAVLSSAEVPGGVILRTLDAARALRDLGVPTIGGFHTPLEREVLTFLLRGAQPVIVSPAHRLHPLRLPGPSAAALAEGRLLLVSRFGERLRRGTARTADQRNALVGALAERALIAHAAPGSRTERLARRLLEWGVPVFTWDEGVNADLVRLGARPVRSVEECLP